MKNANIHDKRKVCSEMMKAKSNTRKSVRLDISYDIGIKTPVQDVPKLKYYRNSAENENRLADSKYHNPGD